MTILEKLQKIQVELKAPKNQRNNFGKYNYRSAEDILESVKPFEAKYKVVFKITDELKELGGHVYVDSEAKVIDTESIDRESSISSTAQAIIDFTAKGMQMPQRTGSASSYAKKYALGNLLLLDDTKDSDATNNHSKTPKNASNRKVELKATAPEFDKVKKYLKDGGSMAVVESKYTLTTQVKELLNK
jgi:hypothetical protein